MASEKRQPKRKWTPGPWRYGVNLDRTDAILAGITAAAPVIGLPARAPSFSEDEMRANAHLMTAAPDLYDALEEVLGHAFCADWCMSGAGKDCTCGSEVVAAKARAALRKAEGLS